MSSHRNSPVQMTKEEFVRTGHQLVNRIADLIDSIGERPVTRTGSAESLEKMLGKHPLPSEGADPDTIISRATELLFDHSLFNGHPRFFGYITSSPAPIGALADLLAAAVNPNVGANVLSPIATEIEKQTVQWLSEMIGLKQGWGGLLVSGGNMANFTAFLTARTAKTPASVKEEGLSVLEKKLVIYCSAHTHTWIEKAVVLFGLGTKSVRWIAAGPDQRMDNALLRQAIEQDLQLGFQPLMVVGTAGDVSTGAIDDLKGIASICRQYKLWFHIDGAYGAPAAAIPAYAALFDGMNDADSIAIDPHKWLYSPLEAGCVLIKDPNLLLQTFSSHPVYYNFNAGDEPSRINYYEYGLQNSRGFRALKVWLGLQQAGLSGYQQMISEDIRLSKLMFRLADEHPELEAITQHLSICTFRYKPGGRKEQTDLNKLNEELVNRLQNEGKIFVSNAVINGMYCLRACIVNFRTNEDDIYEMIRIVIETARDI